MMIKILGTLILLCAIPSHAAVEQWRGKLEISKQISLVVGVNIDTDTQTLTLDSPNQKMFEYVPTEASVSDKAVSFSDNKLNASYEGQFVDGKLVGTFTQGKARPLTFSLLTADAKSQLALEGTYAGALDINGKKLPLELQVAALEDGFHATLDSPAQQSFGIPLSQFAITTQVLSFESEMINAAFKGTMKEGEYNGTFTQGFAMPLSLKKKQNERK
ncbi:hypothetical protein PA25_31660 [Pseudoalteromonas sp. A25]|uniref:hypothetical protein n=1 Tax=Pseudoalteromonas sp. A25 TaxID=116092 RepID=UPI0012608C9E|nr:hypothetical protein [Pseudoalteromonas sp. A25]BBN83181.1 hypothetical protein PA25_31660 [Pseudoalteromonas sp. A25]